MTWWQGGIRPGEGDFRGELCPKGEFPPRWTHVRRAMGFFTEADVPGIRFLTTHPPPSPIKGGFLKKGVKIFGGPLGRRKRARAPPGPGNPGEPHPFVLLFWAESKYLR